MVKSYIKYEHSQTFGIINSASANVIWAPSSSSGVAYVGANEEILCWDIKKGELLSRWKDKACNSEVTVIARSEADGDIYAVGYGDGSIRIWDSRIATIIIGFNGHRSAITTLAFDNSGVRLASGSKDTDIIVWDLVAEVGLFKLRGHKDQITGLRFVQSSGSNSVNNDQSAEDGTAVNGEHEASGQAFLLSTSKDALIKMWDIASQYCIETHVAQSNGECWALGLSKTGDICITAGNDGEVKVWSFDAHALYAPAEQGAANPKQQVLRATGAFYRQGKDRTISISFTSSGEYISFHGSDKAVELWRVRSEAEVQRSLARKRRRKREKAAAVDKKAELADGIADELINQDDDISSADITDIFVPYVIVRPGGRVSSTAFAESRGNKALKLVIATSNNQLEVYSVPTREKTKKSKGDEAPDYNRTFAVDLPGHRTDVRSLSLSSDDRMLASASNGSLKIWNMRTQACLRTLECGYALCCSFLPGDRMVLIGTKTGELELFDIASSSLIDRIQGHEGSIWTLQVHPDGRSVVTGSADKQVKFWDFQVVQEEIPGTKRTTSRLALIHKRTLKVSDDVLNLCFSPDSRLLAVATLDNTVKVFFVDSLKLFLNLYGHKLPVLNMSISNDSKLIATCSADKNIRLWGLDFGDCYKAFFAHSDSIMQVSFIAHPISKDEGHHFFSASKDRTIKIWDGDKFEQIQKLEGHHGEIWAMAVSRTGEFVVSVSHDKSLRIWSQTDDQIFLEEERERELEEMYEATLATNLDGDNVDGDQAGDEVVAASKQTIATLTAGEKIMEAIELGIADLEEVRSWEAQRQTGLKVPAPQRNPLLMALGNVTAERHVLNTVQSIPAAALHDALLVLPFSAIPSLFTFLRIWITKEWNIPLACRVLFFMLKTHHTQIVASRELKMMLEGVRSDLRACLDKQKDAMGFNMAALRFMEQQAREREVKTLEDEEERVEAMYSGKGRKKRAFIDVA